MSCQLAFQASHLADIVSCYLNEGRLLSGLDSTKQTAAEDEYDGSDLGAILAAALWYRSAPDPVFFVELNGCIHDLNDEAQRVYGWTRDEIVGQPLSRIVPEKRHEQADDLWNRCLRGENSRNVESLRQNRDGREIPVRVTTTLVSDQHGKTVGVAITTRDISELKQAEARLRRMTKLFMDGPTPMSILDLHGRVLDVNRASENMFGWSREERLGKHPKSALSRDWHETVDAVIERSLEGETVQNLEIDAKTKDGDDLNLLVSTSLLTDEDEQRIGVGVITKDISDFKRAQKQLEKTARDLELCNRELREFTFAMSHDMQEPLRSITGFGKMLRERCESQLDAEGREFLDFVTDGAEYLRSLIDDLLAYAKLTRIAKEFEPVDCTAISQRAVGNLRAAIEESTATVECDPLPTVSGDALQLTSLFQNLIGNAIKYRSDQRPHVRVSATRDGDNWQFAVRDNGIGIKPESAERIFDVFCRLHAREDVAGTGIGLATSKKIVERHGGRIWVESQPGKGSAFFFTIAEEIPQ
jgi:PAS domain S-box-containing protein